MNRLLPLLLLLCVFTADAQFMSAHRQAAKVNPVVGGGGSPCSTVVVALGPVRYWAFDEGTGTSAADSSGNSATGTLVGGPSWVAGKAGATALSFDSRSKYVTSSATVATTQQTFAAWIFPDNLTGDSGHNMVISGTVANNWLEVDPSGHVNFHSANGNDFTDTSTTITTGQWWHIAATISSSHGAADGVVKIYINGVLDYTSGAAVGLTITQAYDVSTYGGAPGNFGFIGRIDEPVLSDRVLNPTEINSIARCN